MVKIRGYPSRSPVFPTIHRWTLPTPTRGLVSGAHLQSATRWTINDGGVLVRNSIVSQAWGAVNGVIPYLLGGKGPHFCRGNYVVGSLTWSRLVDIPPFLAYNALVDAQMTW